MKQTFTYISHVPQCSYDIPVIKDTVTYADSLLKSYALTAAALARAEAIALSLYKTAGEPIQARLQGQVRVVPSCYLLPYRYTV